MEKKYDVFISHSSVDKPILKELIEQLKEKGLSLFIYDEVRKTGKDMLEKCIEGIENSRIFLGAYTENYAKSGICIKEAKVAAVREVNGLIHLLMYRFDENVPYNELPKSITYDDVPTINIQSKEGLNGVLKDVMSYFPDKNTNGWPFGQIIVTTGVGGIPEFFPEIKDVLERLGSVSELFKNDDSVKINVKQLHYKDKIASFSLPMKDRGINEELFASIQKVAIMLKSKIHLLLTDEEFKKDDIFTTKINEFVTTVSNGAGSTGSVMIVYLPKDKSLDFNTKILRDALEENYAKLSDKH